MFPHCCTYVSDTWVVVLNKLLTHPCSCAFTSSLPPLFFLFFLCYIIDVRFPLHDLSHRYIPFVLHTANVSCHLGLDWIHLTVQTQTDTQRYTPHHIPIYIYPTHIPTSNVPRFPSRSFYPLNPRMIPASLRSFVVKLALYPPPVVALGLQQHLLLNVYIRA